MQTEKYQPAGQWIMLFIVCLFSQPFLATEILLLSVFQGVLRNRKNSSIDPKRLLLRLSPQCEERRSDEKEKKKKCRSHLFVLKLFILYP